MAPSADIPPLKTEDLFMRAMDVVLALAILAFAALPMLLVASAILLDDGGPVLFRQPRVGRSRQPFSILKFRTMTHDPNRATGAAAGPVSIAEREKFQTTIPGDARITRVGRFLRPLHLDELPQMINVLRGEMSLVGVRPDVPVQEADYLPQEWVDRHVLRPGITGLAQIDTTIDSMTSRTRCDLHWVRNRSLCLYCTVLLATFNKILKRSSL